MLDMVVIVAALLALACFFAWQLVMPMLFGFVVGGIVFFVAPFLHFHATADLIILCGAAGLAMGIGNILVFGTKGGGDKE